MKDASELPQQDSSLITSTSGSKFSDAGSSVSIGSMFSSVTPLTAQNVKLLFTKALREGVQQYTTCLSSWGLTSEKDFYAEALKFAQITYGTVVAGLSARLNGQVKFPSADEITTTSDVDSFYKTVVSNKEIRSTDLEMHLAERSKLTPEQREAYEEDQHSRARVRIAGSWAEAAGAVVTLKELVRIATKPTLEEQIRAQSAKKEGRDIPGRIAYYLMNVPFDAIAEALVGLDPMEGAGKQRGMGQLGLNIANAFSDAACHNDARQMCDAMSQRSFTKAEAVVKNPKSVEDTTTTILSQIGSCPGPQQVVKLSNFANHSTVYLISGKKCTQYESIAGKDSTTILYNDLIRNVASESDLGPALKSGVAAIAKGGENKLEWEVHQATSLEVLRERVNTRLRNGTTEVSIGVALAAHQKEEEADGLNFDKYKTIPIPLDLINQGLGGRISLFNYGDANNPESSALTNGQRYRMNAQGRWMRVIYRGLIENLPNWMNPCGLFEIAEVSAVYKNPQMREPDTDAGEAITSMMNFIFQVIKTSAARGSLEKPATAGYPKEYGEYTIVEDPFWASGGINRRIIYRKKK